MTQLSQARTSSSIDVYRKHQVLRLHHSVVKLRKRIDNLVRSAHISMCIHLCKRADTIVVPPFNFHSIKGGSKTNRKRMSTLSHGAFRNLLRHFADRYGKEYVNASETWTTRYCPICTNCVPKFTGKVFMCKCGYTAERDAKSAYTLAIKCLRRDWMKIWFCFCFERLYIYTHSRSLCLL